jgi:elongation factor G
VFVNKLDRVGADFARALGEVATRLRAKPVAITRPVYEGEVLVGVVDLVSMEHVTWPGEGEPSTPVRTPAVFDNWRERVLEAAADEDPEILAAVVEGRAVETERIWAALRRATIAGRIVPVLAGSAYKYRGVEPLLDAVVALLPSPRDRGGVEGPLAALAFKIVFDEHGQLSFVRVYRGVLAKGDTVLAAGAERKLRVGRLVKLMAADREEVDELRAGEIGAVIGLPIAGGETLCAVDAPVVLEKIVAPEPVVRVAIEPKRSEDRQKFGIALGRMVAADPSLRLESDPETGQTLLAGMGQLHLDVRAEQLETEHGVSVTIGKPLVAYRTTVREVVRVEIRHVKQSGGPGQWAHVVLEVGPAESGAGLVFEHRIKGGALTREYIRGVETGVRAAMSHGLLGGHPVVDVKVVLIDGSTHVSDSSELAFAIAGGKAFDAAAAEAEPTLLEPIMHLEVSCQEEHVGTVVGDLARRRGQVVELEARGDERVVRGEVPVAETFGYAGALGGMTHGRGRFTLEPARYAPV